MAGVTFFQDKYSPIDMHYCSTFREHSDHFPAPAFSNCLRPRNTDGGSNGNNQQHTHTRTESKVNQPTQPTPAPLITQGGSQVIPYMGTVFLVSIFSNTACRLLILYIINQTLKLTILRQYVTCRRVLISAGHKMKLEYRDMSILRPESNVLSPVLVALAFTAITLACYQNLLTVCLLLCSPSCKTHENARGRKKLRLGPSTCTLPPPSAATESPPPSTRVTEVKNTPPYTAEITSCTLYKLTSPKYTSYVNVSREPSCICKYNTKRRELIDENSCRVTTSATDPVYSCILVCTQYTYTLDERASESSRHSTISCARYLYNSMITPTQCVDVTYRDDILCDVSASNTARSYYPTQLKYHTGTSELHSFAIKTNRELCATLTQVVVDKLITSRDSQSRQVQDYLPNTTATLLTSSKSHPQCYHRPSSSLSEYLSSLTAGGNTWADSPHDTDSSNYSNQSSTNKTNGSTNSGNNPRANRASARPGLSRNNSLSGQSNEDGDEGDKPPMNWEKPKSQCENSAAISLSEPHHVDPRSLQISLDQNGLSSDTTFLGRLSRQLMDTFSNITLFPNQEHPETSLGAESFNLNISVTTVDQNTSGVPDPWPTPIIKITPAKPTPDHDNDPNECDGYFTGRGNPIITPIQSCRRNILLPSRTATRTRARSFSSHSRPYLPPAELIKLTKKLNLRLEPNISDGTPIRKRSPSESNIDFSESIAVPKHELGCVRIEEEGFHDCSAGRNHLIHLKHDFLSGDSLISRPSIVTELEKVLTSGQAGVTKLIPEIEDLPPTHNLVWDRKTVESAINHLEIPTQKIDEIAREDPLLYLLAKLNLHFSEIDMTTGKTLFNILRITSMVGRSSKFPLGTSQTTNRDPILLLHMGKERAVNIIPKKLSLAMMDVFDVQLGNFAVFSVFPKTRESMNISLPREKALEEDDLDLHILVSAMTSGSDITLQQKASTSEVKAPDKCELLVNDNPDVIPDHQLLHGGSEAPQTNSENEEPSNLNQNVSVSPTTQETPSEESSGQVLGHVTGMRPNDLSESGDSTDTDAATHLSINKKTGLPEDQKRMPEPTGQEKRDDLKDAAEDKVSVAPHIQELQEPPDNQPHNEPQNTKIEQPASDKTSSDETAPPDDLIKIPPHTDSLPDDQKSLFVSVKSSVLIVNGVKNKMLKSWLKTLKIKPKTNDRAFEHRETILAYIQEIMEQKVVPPPKFIRSFIEQLADEAIDDEMNYQLIKAPDSQTSMGKKKKMIKDKVLYQHYPNMVHNYDIVECKPVSPLSLFEKTKDNSNAAAKTASIRNAPPLHSPTTSPSPSGEDSDWDESSKDTRKKCKTKKKKKKPTEVQTNDENLKEREEKMDKAQKKGPTKAKAVSTEVEPPNRFSQLETAMELLEKRVIDIDLEQTALKDCMKKESTTQKSCLNLLMEEDKKKKRSFNQQVENSINKQIGPLFARIQALEATTSSLKEGFELQTQNMEKMVDEIRVIRYQTEENKKEVSQLHTQLEMIKERQREIAKQLHNTKPPKTNSTSPDNAELQDINVPDINRTSNTVCHCKHAKPKVTSTGSQTEMGRPPRDSRREEVSSRKPDTDSLNNRHRHKRTEFNQSRAQGNSNETRSIANMMSMTASANSVIHPSRIAQPNQSLDVPTWALGPPATHEVTELANHQLEKTAHGSDANEERRKNLSSNAVNEEPRAYTYSHRRRKCLLVHDSTLSGFDANKFSRTFDVTLYPTGSCHALNKDKRFEDKLRSLSPECIFVHLGTNDILSQRTTEKVAETFKELIWYLLENTKAQLCFSLVIPTKNGDSLNVRIREFNELLTKLVSDARAAKQVHKSCLFSYSNNSVEYHNIYNQGTREVRLTEIGRRIMWSRLCDGLNKALRLPRRQLSGTRNVNGRQTSEHRQSNIQTRSHNG